MQRLRQIEDEIERADEPARARRTPSATDDPARWRRLAERWDFGEVNDLIDRHNRWYPIEARLPMDPRTRDFVKIGGRPTGASRSTRVDPRSVPGVDYTGAAVAHDHDHDHEHDDHEHDARARRGRAGARREPRRGGSSRSRRSASTATRRSA